MIGWKTEQQGGSSELGNFYSCQYFLVCSKFFRIVAATICLLEWDWNCESGYYLFFKQERSWYSHSKKKGVFSQSYCFLLLHYNSIFFFVPRFQLQLTMTIPQSFNLKVFSSENEKKYVLIIFGGKHICPKKYLIVIVFFRGFSCKTLLVRM